MMEIKTEYELQEMFSELLTDKKWIAFDELIDWLKYPPTHLDIDSCWDIVYELQKLCKNKT